MKNLYFLILFLSSITCCTAQWVSGGTQLSFGPAADHKMFTTVDSHGGFYTAWMSLNMSTNLTDIKLGAYDSAGVVNSGWTSGGITVSDSGNNFAPQILTSEDDGVIIAWYGYVKSNDYTELYIQKYSPSGTALWNGGEPVNISNDTNYAHKYPILVSDKNNGVFLTWTRYDKQLTSLSPDVLMQHIDNTGHVAAGWNAQGADVAISADRETNEQLALTKDTDYIYVVYNTGLADSGALVLNKYNAADGSLASGWTSSGKVITYGPYANPATNHDLWIFADDNGNAVIFWIEIRQGTLNGELYMSQISPSGTALVNIKYLAGKESIDGIDYLEVVENEEGNYMVAFNDLSIFNDLEAMMVQPNGTVTWYNSSITANGESAYPKPASDGKKGMFLVYELTIPPYTLHALALDSAGHLYNGWSLPGPNFGALAVNVDFTSPNYQFDIKSARPGEAIAVWADTVHHIFSCNIWYDKTMCATEAVTAGIYETPSSTLNTYPNPFHDFISIALPDHSLKYSVMLYDLAGREVISAKNFTGQNINTAGLAKGMYFCRLVNGNDVIGTSKVVKE